MLTVEDFVILQQELLKYEHFLRTQADRVTGDSKLASRLDRGADFVERAYHRCSEIIWSLQLSQEKQEKG